MTKMFYVTNISQQKMTEMSQRKENSARLLCSGRFGHPILS